MHIAGHANNTGVLVYNINFSERRSESLVVVLVNDYKIEKADLFLFEQVHLLL